MVGLLDDSEIAAAVGQEIAFWRRRIGVSRDGLGETIGISGNTIGRYERGETQPTFSEIWRMCAAFDIAVADFANRVSVTLDLELSARLHDMGHSPQEYARGYRMYGILGDFEELSEHDERMPVAADEAQGGEPQPGEGTDSAT